MSFSYKFIPFLFLIHLWITYFTMKWVISELEIDKYFEENSFPPESIDEVRKLSALLKNHENEYSKEINESVITDQTRNKWLAIRVFHFVGFYFLQTWWIPGTFMFNLLSGSLFGSIEAWVYWVFLNTIGGYSWFLISKHFGAELVESEYIQKRARYLKELTMQHRSDLFFYLTFLRIFPGSPNWLMNISFPHIGIKDHYIIFSIFIGLMPWNFIVCEAGSVLSTIQSKSDIVNPENGLKLAGIAILFLLPPLIKNLFCKKMEEEIKKVKSD